MILLFCFLLHVGLNRKYYKVMLVTSILPSKDLFFFLDLFPELYGLWRVLHIVSAIVFLICCLGHILLHMTLFQGLLKKVFPGKGFETGWKIGSRAAAVFMNAFVVVASLRVSRGLFSDRPSQNTAVKNYETTENSGDKENDRTDASKKERDNPKEDEELTEQENGKDAEEKREGEAEDRKERSYIGKKDEEYEEIIEEPEKDEDKMTLEEYLKSLTCNGCGRRCLLLYPRCRKEEVQAERAKNAYYAENNQ